MIPGRRSKATIAGLALCLILAQAARAASAENEHVVVGCNAPRVEVTVANHHFDVLAPGYPDSFTADVTVSPRSGWELVRPTASELPLTMKGGDTEGYEVRRDPEDSGSGTIAFHNYYIKSNIDGGAKNIVVPAGASVIYTAHRNGERCLSDWTVSGHDRTATKRNTSQVVFNRSGWNVSEWFVPAFETPKAGVYAIEAKDVQHALLKDSGVMTVYAGRFTLYAKPPENGELLDFSLKFGKVDFDVGHTSWMLEVVPASAKGYVLERFKEDPSKAKHLDVCVGYWPSTNLLDNPVPLGVLKVDQPEGASKTYDITIDQLVTGLNRTYAIEQSPGTYILGTYLYVYNITTDTIFRDQTYASDWNCTSVALDVGGTMGLSMPDANATWSTDSLMVGGRELKVEYKGSCPWKLHKSITSGN